MKEMTIMPTKQHNWTKCPFLKSDKWEVCRGEGHYIKNLSDHDASLNPYRARGRFLHRYRVRKRELSIYVIYIKSAMSYVMHA